MKSDASKKEAASAQTEKHMDKNVASDWNKILDKIPVVDKLPTEWEAYLQ